MKPEEMSEVQSPKSEVAAATPGPGFQASDSGPVASAPGPCIRALSPVVANQIAAGEVVERPASVVKELVENAIDAHATRIEVIVTAGGRKLVSVADDGVGMVRDDALMCLERQATSKIRTSEDIAAITTMGFRGEAIPSIASVSRFRLRTRPRALDAGTEVEVVGGQLVDVRDCGCPAGTLVEVRDLFFNLPARRKFLRTYQTEQALVRTMFNTLALANPGIAFSLKSDGMLLHELPPCDSFEDRLRDLYGPELFERLRPVDASLAGVRVWGFAGLPDCTRADRSEQFFFVNHRPATAPAIHAAVREAYPPLDAGRRPVFFLFLDLDPASVDVNVHPAKREVRFRQPAAVREAVILALRRALVAPGAPEPTGGPGDFTPQWDASPAGGPGNPAPPWGATSPAGELGGQRPPSFAPVAPLVERPLPFPLPDDPLAPTVPLPQRPAFPLPSGATPPQTESGNPAPLPSTPQPPTSQGAPAPIYEAPAGAPWKWCRPLGMLGDGYALLETDDGLVVLEPRAAHMRVLYENLLDAAAAEAPPPSQRLLLPESVELPPLDAARVRARLAVFRAMGFGIEPLDGDAFLVDALPPLLSGVPCRTLLADIASGMEEVGAKKGRERPVEEAGARAAAKAAVPTRARLDPAELRHLVQALARCRMPYTSPFGKPTVVLFSYRELSRKFGLS